jgi:hypothetical protein
LGHLGEVEEDDVEPASLEDEVHGLQAAIEKNPEPVGRRGLTANPQKPLQHDAGGGCMGRVEHVERIDERCEPTLAGYRREDGLEEAGAAGRPRAAYLGNLPARQPSI